MATGTNLRANVALFFAGFGTFSLLYCVQPVMPNFSREFGVSPAISSLSLSVATASLAATIVVAGFVSESFDRRKVISTCLFAASALSLLSLLSPSWPGFIAVRTLVGVALGAVPVLAMAYAAEEARGQDAGFAMGLYIGGTALGGMAGRVITGLVAGVSTWRPALATVAATGLIASGAFWFMLPPSRQFIPQRLGFRERAAMLAASLTAPGLPWLYLSAFLLMGSFVAIFNYTGYRLATPAFGLNEFAIGAIFLLYLLGMVASPVFGRWADRFGRGPTLAAATLLMLIGVVLTIVPSLWSVIGGLALTTVGFFAGHAVASGWVGNVAPGTKGQAASLYLLAYYLGASIIGLAGGWYWAQHGWIGVAAFVGVLLLVALAVPLRLARLHRSGRNAA